MGQHNLKVTDFQDQERAQAIYDLYKKVLRRSPDDRGWQSHYNSGKSIEYLWARFKESDEYKVKSKYWLEGFSINKIADNLYVGATIEPGKELTATLTHGLQAVVCLHKGAKYDFTKFHRVMYVPFPDSQLMPVREAVQAVKAVETFINDGLATLVHCRWGESRSPSIAAFYMAKELNISFDAAFNIIKMHRPGVRVSHGLLTPQRIQEIHNAVRI